MNKLIFSILLLAITSGIFAQGVGIGTNAPDASAILELKSTSKGLLLPRMTAAEKSAIITPKAGLIVYQTDGTKGLYVYNGSAWQTAGSEAATGGWSLQGNNGTTSGNFLGTLDSASLQFRIHNEPAGIVDLRIANTALGALALGKSTTLGGENSAFGYNSLGSNTMGNANAAFGVASLFSNTIGTYNAAFGFASMSSNVNGQRNIAMGSYSLGDNESGGYNSAIGFESMRKNVSGNANVAIGTYALGANVAKSNLVAIGDSALARNGRANVSAAGGRDNVAVGAKAMVSNYEGSQNTATGFEALYNNTVGNGNSAYGTSALVSNIEGDDNTAVGFETLRDNTTGIENTSVGHAAMIVNKSGEKNVAMGVLALGFNQTGNENVAIGFRSLDNNFYGSGNVALGSRSLEGNYSGTNNVAVGNHANISAASELTNAVAIGAYSRSDCNGCVVLGPVTGVNAATLTAKVGIGQTSPTALLHLKQPDDAYPIWSQGLKIERHGNTNSWVIGVDFADDFDFAFNGVAKAYIRDIDGVFVTVSDARMKKDVADLKPVLPSLLKLKPKTYHYNDNKSDDPLALGFMAQDVEKLFPSFVTTKGPDNMKGVAYQNFHVVAIKAIQEQQVLIASLESQLEQSQRSMQTEIDQLKTQIRQITQQLSIK